MTQPSTASNPPTPANYKLMSQAQVTPAMTTWAVEILHDPATYPMFAIALKAFGTQAVLARVEWHPPDFNNGVVHRGVTLYVPVVATPTIVRARGIDISGYQPIVDWTKVKAAGNTFAIIKATEATTLLDHSFIDHWVNAQVVGVMRGAYHFFRPRLDAVAQARFFLSMLPSRGELPPVLDVEVADGVSMAQIAAGVATWVDYVFDNYGRSLIYTSPGFWNLLPMIPDIAQKADLWVAQWGPSSPSKVNGWPAWTFWQYTSRATIAGIPGTADVDGDYFNGTEDELRAYAAAHGGVTPTPTPSFDLTTVKGVQAALNYLGQSPPLTVDGIEGPKTLAAVKSFQLAHGLVADGIVGPKTRAALLAAIANR